MLGYDIGNRSALNAFRHFARFMNAEYRPIPSSIIAEGDDIWNGAGDRGDAAMIAYGAARYALARGERNLSLIHISIRIKAPIRLTAAIRDSRFTSRPVLKSGTSRFTIRAAWR